MKIFITGVSKGIGRALTDALLAEDHEVWGVARAGKEPFSNPHFIYQTCDITDDNQTKKVIDKMTRKRFYPDAVILNAGIVKHDIANDNFSLATARPVFETNLIGALTWVDHFLRLPTKPKQFVAISSIFAIRPDATSVSYAASKAALAMAFRSFSLARRSASCPEFKTIYFGPIDTEISPSYRRAKKVFYIPGAKTAGEYVKGVLNKNGENFYLTPP